MKRLTINPVPCTGCLCCQSVCSLSRTGEQDPAASAFRVELDLFGGLHAHVFCRQCGDAPCADICPVGAISPSGVEGSWMIDPELCIGCGACVAACPFGAIGWRTGLGPVKCHLCGGEPLCASACMFGAIRFLDVSDPEFGLDGMPSEEQAPALGRGVRVVDP